MLLLNYEYIRDLKSLAMWGKIDVALYLITSKRSPDLRSGWFVWEQISHTVEKIPWESLEKVYRGDKLRVVYKCIESGKKCYQNHKNGCFLMIQVQKGH